MLGRLIVMEKEVVSSVKKLEYNRKYYQENKEKIKQDQKRRQREYLNELRIIKQKMGK